MQLMEGLKMDFLQSSLTNQNQEEISWKRDQRGDFPLAFIGQKEKNSSWWKNNGD